MNDLKTQLEVFEEFGIENSLDLTKSKTPDDENPYYETLTFVAYEAFKYAMNLE